MSRQIPRSHPRIAQTYTIVIIWQCKSCGYICIERVSPSRGKYTPQPARDCLVDMWTHRDGSAIEKVPQTRGMCPFVGRDRFSRDSLSDVPVVPGARNSRHLE